jgi:glycosyltransferase involved in cell wall biosynthesis
MAPLITIGIPAYNALPWLKDCIESVRSQSDPNFEILVIDDGSTDGTWEFIRSIRESRLRVLRQENRGITKTLNRMLDEIRTPWLMRLDADDVAMPNRIEMVSSLIKTNPDAGLFYSDASHYQNGHCLGLLKTTKGSPQAIREITKSGRLLAINHSSVTLNTSKARATGGYRFDLNVEEYDLFWRMALRYDAVYIDKSLVGYRVNPNGISFRDVRSQSINLLYVQYLLLSHLWNLEPLPYHQVKVLLETLLDNKAMNFSSAMRNCYAAIGKRRYLQAVTSAFRGFTGSPFLFASRLLYQFGIHGQSYVGVDPKRYRAHSADLWSENIRESVACCEANGFAV